MTPQAVGDMSLWEVFAILEEWAPENTALSSPTAEEHDAMVEWALTRGG